MLLIIGMNLISVTCYNSTYVIVLLLLTCNIYRVLNLYTIYGTVFSVTYYTIGQRSNIDALRPKVVVPNLNSFPLNGHLV